MYRVEEDWTGRGFEIRDAQGRLLPMRLFVAEHAYDLCAALNMAAALCDQRSMPVADTVALIDAGE